MKTSGAALISQPVKQSRTPLEHLKSFAPHAKEGANDEQALLKLPYWPAQDRAMPNHLCRAGVFAPLGRQKRRYLVNQPLTSRSDVMITFNGPQLDESDGDVWMQVLQENRDAVAGSTISIVRADFLRRIGRTKSATTYRWLDAVLRRLVAARIGIQTRHYSFGIKPTSSPIQLIQHYHLDVCSQRVFISLDPRIPILFSRREYSRINWNKRLLISSNRGMAKFLQRLVAASSDEQQKYSVEFLRGIMQYSSPDRKFRAAVMGGLKELERLGILCEPCFAENWRGVEQVVWIRSE